MRITRDLLHKFAQETVTQRVRSEPDLHAAYLTGSLLSDDPLLGGTTDIDLVLVHKYKAPFKRECKALTREISLDIFHKVKDDYSQHRQLRQDPWMGYPLTNYHILLFDTDHWLEFIQSSVNADFHKADNVLARVNTLLESARENWLLLAQTPFPSHHEWLHHYMKILALTANAISGLIGPPLTTRRFMVTFNNRIETLGIPKTLTGFNGLLGVTEDHDDKISNWFKAFNKDLTYLTETATYPVHLDPCRQGYYLDGVKSLIEDGSPDHALWPLLRIWLDVHLATTQPLPEIETWESLLETLTLTKETTSQKTEALDAYLDSVEILIESWADAYGI